MVLQRQIFTQLYYLPDEHIYTSSFFFISLSLFSPSGLSSTVTPLIFSLVSYQPFLLFPSASIPLFSSPVFSLSLSPLVPSPFPYHPNTYSYYIYLLNSSVCDLLVSPLPPQSLASSSLCSIFRRSVTSHSIILLPVSHPNLPFLPVIIFFHLPEHSLLSPLSPRSPFPTHTTIDTIF